VALPFAEAVAGRSVLPPSDARWLVGLAYAGATVGVGLLAGIYPAFALSSGSSLQALRGRVVGPRGGRQLRRVLVTAQFAVSLAFVAGALIVQQQLDFLRTADLGFDRAATVSVPLGGWDGQTFARVRAELGGVPGVMGIAALTSLPGGRHGGYSATWPGREGDDLMLRASVASGEAVEALGLRVVAGEALPAVAAPSEAGAFRFVVNEEVARHIAGSNEAAIGHPFVMNGREGEIAGVVEDFHYASLHEAVGPFVLFSEAEPYYSTLVVRLAPDASADVLDRLATRWNAAQTGRPFVYRFLDDQLGALYASDRRLGSLVGLAALVTVLVACMGLFGLAAFSVARRRKEIGVRKALGAAAVGIVGLVSREFAVLVGLGFVIGAPVAWWFGMWWKEGFAYSASGAGWAIAASGILVLVLALLTVSYHAWRAATLDPALVLRDE
jgi:putative ABC transport system permease protein